MEASSQSWAYQTLQSMSLPSPHFCSCVPQSKNELGAKKPHHVACTSQELSRETHSTLQHVKRSVSAGELEIVKAQMGYPGKEEPAHPLPLCNCILGLL